jgi:hypothetical protein
MGAHFKTDRPTTGGRNIRFRLKFESLVQFRQFNHSVIRGFSSCVFSCGVLTSGQQTLKK